MKVTVLGCGTSHGVPMIGCDCAVCTSTDPKNRRYRPAIVVESDHGQSVLIDTPPELRLALIENQISRLDAIFYTHSHADHIFGLDDVRTFNYRTQRPMPVYAEASVTGDIRRIYEYIFKPTQAGGGKPQVTLNEIAPGVPISGSFGMEILPLRVCHGRLPVLAYKFGRGFAYVTDVSHIPAETWPELENLDVLMLDAVRLEPHETHFHLEAALEVIEKLKPTRAYLTHLAHDYDYKTTNATLPRGVELAYDRQVIDIPND